MLKLGLLGPFYAELDGTIVEGFVSAKAQSLLCYLAMNQTAHNRQLLAGLFWGDSPEKKALGALRVTLSNLRKLVPGYLESTRVSVSFRRDRPYWLDVEAVDSVVGALETSGIAEQEGALSLARGEFLEDFYIDGSPDFELWLLNQRTYWKQATLRILARLATCYMERQQYEQAAVTLRRSLHLEPWDETTHRSLMEALARMGDFNGALAQYEACCRALEAELGVEPMPETTALYRRIQAARRQEAYPLPQDDAPFIGREEELARIEATLGDPGCRLLTIVGLGGSGKTRLALAAARRANAKRRRRFLNGVVFVPLAGITSAAELTGVLAGSLGLLFEGKESPATQLIKFLSDKELLVVMDNAEHLAGDLDLVQRILQAAPDVKLLVTSREPLRLQAEWRFDIEGMRYPQVNGRGAAGVLAYEAVELFVQSARQAQPAFVLDDTNAADVVQVCRLVAGMPLGVKLAAAWARAMTTSEIAGEVAQSLDFLADGFRDLPRRQRSVRAVFESTWARLPEPARRTFAALYIFCGGFTAGAAIEVTGLTRSQLLDLVDRSLVQRLGRRGDEERYDLHPLMRQFAGEKMGEGKHLDEVAKRHSQAYLDLVMASEAELFGPAPQATVSALRPELDNVRQSWQWAANHGQRQLLHRAARALAALYEFAGLFEEGAQAFGWAVQQLDRQAPGKGRDSVLCDLLGYQVGLTLDRGVTDVAEAMDRLERLTRRLIDDFRLAKLYYLQGRLVERLRGFDVAISYYEHAAELFEVLEQPRDLARALNALGFALANLGIAGEALEKHRRSFRIAQELDDVRLQVLSLALMGVASHYLSRHRDALAYWEEALAHYVQLEDELAILRTSNNICYVQNMLGNYEEALQVAERLQHLLIRVADHVSESDAHDTLGDIYFSLGDYSQARYHYMQAIENARAGRVRLKEAWCLTGLAELEIASGRYAFAENHLQRAQTLYQEEDHPRDRARFLAALGELCWRTGRREEAINFSLQSIAGLDEGGEPIYSSPLLMRAGRLFLEAGDASRAQALLQRSLALAESIGHKPTILQAQLLLRRLEIG